MHLAWALCICASAAATEPQQGELVAALTSLQKKFDGLEGTVKALQARVGVLEENRELLEQENRELRARATAPRQPKNEQQISMSALGEAGDPAKAALAVVRAALAAPSQADTAVHLES